MGKIIDLLSKALSSAALTAVLFSGAISCESDDQTDNSSFKLYYQSLTDIGPSTNFSLSPSYHGGTPSDFAIYGITLDGSSISSECFIIDPATGMVSLVNTEKAAVGEYKLSVSCKVDGKTRKFADAITVTMMKAVPDGIKMDPERIDVKLADILASKGSVELPTSKVTTDGNHISIRNYKIANVRKDGAAVVNKDMFAISSKGVVSISGGNTEMLPGLYVLDLRLITHVATGDSEEGLFANALSINVTSAPLTLTYEPNSGKVEKGFGFSSMAPSINGSLDGLKYSIKSVTPAESSVTIDHTTGVISVSAAHKIPIGTVCAVSVTATNDYGSKDFDDIYTINSVDYIAPITKFVYDNASDVIQTTSFSNPVKTMDGGDVTYAFVNLPASLSELAIDASTGTVSAPKGNSIATGTYTVTVEAANAKGSKQASFSLTVIKNPYMFTYVNWGNNLNLAPVRNYASQYRLEESDKSLTIPVKESDLPSGKAVKYSMDKVYCAAEVSIDESTGTITVSASDTKRIDFIFVTVTCGNGSDADVSQVIPVFFQHFNAVSGYEVRYNPFVFKCNPKTGGKSAVPAIVSKDGGAVAMDYRRNFNYYDLEGEVHHGNGQPKNKGFLNTLWTAYFTAKGEAVNTGKREPMSAWDSKVDETLRLGYTDKTDYSVVINADKFRDESGYANGIFFGQQTMGAAGTDPGSGPGSIWLAIWFDTDF